jgi:hypothetical protein
LDLLKIASGKTDAIEERIVSPIEEFAKKVKL